MQKHSHTLLKKPIKKPLKKPSNAQLDAFEKFYNSYPKKRDKKEALKAFLKINPDEALLAIIMEKLEQFKKTPDWTKDNGQFIPYPSTWLNKERWKDEVLINESRTHLQHPGESIESFNLLGFKPAGD